jgi:two-component system chemotaxis response regulator CheB
MKDFPIVVIGLSAGGLIPLIDLIGQMPHDFQAAVFIVLHRSSEHELHVHLTARTGRSTYMARDLQQFQQGDIYVCPGDQYLSLENGVMRVEHSPKESLYRPSVNGLFRSAAHAYGRRVIGVLLSGMLDDGSAGLWHIKKHGGVTIVQDPAEAEFSSMPQSAVDNVAVDYVLPISQIASKLAELVSGYGDGMAAGPPRILIVEDESVVATALQHSLTDMGYDVIDWVPTGEAGIELALRERPDLVLMDIHLAGALNGIESARMIWQRLQIPIVYCTAHADLETLKAVQTTESYGYVVKPFESPAVRAAIELALARREKELR